MANNGKKEYPINGTETDAVSKYGRKIYKYLRNGKGVTSSVKKAINKRFRKYNKSLGEKEL